ncbi:hypothetical protein NIE88_19825 [Sporolactobacillus shoreicorticis]|uniref:Uncharacterized protein n=1 Tax=Sporolactobacillus shoreicorticis TaxID=1923877 RepID=A0ABW5S2D7_9BACL|nr:hypothetical protein [Sporolactobacillus shoreicorticis]MCO7127994.1 hypothetical protein [Sporolactobacillus shoreicorticis]
MPKKKSAWYLRPKPLLFFCLITPPIGYLLVVSNLDRFKNEERISYLTLATITASLWVLKFLPKTVGIYVWSAILAAFIAGDAIRYLNKRNHK